MKVCIKFIYGQKRGHSTIQHHSTILSQSLPPIRKLCWNTATCCIFIFSSICQGGSRGHEHGRRRTLRLACWLCSKLGEWHHCHLAPWIWRYPIPTLRKKKTNAKFGQIDSDLISDNFWIVCDDFLFRLFLENIHVTYKLCSHCWAFCLKLASRTVTLQFKGWFIFVEYHCPTTSYARNFWIHYNDLPLEVRDSWLMFFIDFCLRGYQLGNLGWPGVALLDLWLWRWHHLPHWW